MSNEDFRVLSSTEIIKKAKETPGVGSYDIQKKYKVKGTFKSNVIKSSIFDEAAIISRTIPGHYPTPQLVSAQVNILGLLQTKNFSNKN